MKPQAARPEIPPPQFQLAKGTRMQMVDGILRDIADGETANTSAETLLQTALREGEEEIGLSADNIMCTPHCFCNGATSKAKRREPGGVGAFCPHQLIYDAGPVSFTSATKNTPKFLWLFAAEMRDEALHESFAPTTSARAWLSVEEAEVLTRPDHFGIIIQTLRKIEQQ